MTFRSVAIGERTSATTGVTALWVANDTSAMIALSVEIGAMTAMMETEIGTAETLTGTVISTRTEDGDE
jgi:hypothetical protein